MKQETTGRKSAAALLLLLIPTANVTAQNTPAENSAREELRILRERLDRLEREASRYEVVDQGLSFADTFDPELEGDAQRVDSSFPITVGRLLNEQPVFGPYDFEEGVPEVSAGVDLRFWGRHKSDVRIDNFVGALGLGFQTYIPNAASANTDAISFDPRDSRFGFAATHSSDGYRYRGVFEIDFFSGAVGPEGSNIEPRLRLGYAEIADPEAGWSIRAGQDWNPVATQNPKMIDFGILGFSGNLFWRPPQITFRQKSGEWDFTGSVVMFLDNSQLERDETVPWFHARAARNNIFGEGSMLALSGGIRQNDIQGNEYDSWMAALEWVIPVGDDIKINGEFWGGQGIGSEFLRLGLDFNGAGNEIAAFGGFTNIEWRVTDKFALNAGYGFDNPDDDDLGNGGVTPVGRAIPFAKNQTAYINARYGFTKHYGVGVEFLHQNTTSLADENLEGERVTLSTWFIF